MRALVRLCLHMVLSSYAFLASAILVVIFCAAEASGRFPRSETALMGLLSMFLPYAMILMVCSVIPDLLQRGMAELCLSKPISRTRFYLGTWTALMFVTVAVTVASAGLATLSFRLAWGEWARGVPAMGVGLAVHEFALVSFAALASVILRNASAVALGAIFVDLAGTSVEMSRVMVEDGLSATAVNSPIARLTRGLAYLFPQKIEVLKDFGDWAIGRDFFHPGPLIATLALVVAYTGLGLVAARRLEP